MNSKKATVFFHIIIFICLALLAGSIPLTGAFAQFAFPGAFGLSPFGFPGGGFGAFPGFGGGFNYGGFGLGGIYNPGFGYGASGFGSTYNPGFNTGFSYGASGLGFGIPSYGLGGTFGDIHPLVLELGCLTVLYSGPTWEDSALRYTACWAD